jgi:hypothetical protein
MEQPVALSLSIADVRCYLLYLIGVGWVRNQVFWCDTVLDSGIALKSGKPNHLLGREIRAPPWFRRGCLLRTAQSIEIFDPFSEQIHNRSADADIQPQEKRIWNDQPSGEELDDQWIFQLVIVTFRSGTIDDIADA